MFLQCVVDFILKLCKCDWHYSSKCVLTSISEVFSGVSIWRKLVEGSLSGLPQLPWSNQRFLNFLIKLGEPFTWETKNAPGRRVTRLAGSPIFYGRVTLLARLTFFHNREIKIHVYGTRQTANVSWEFLKIENKQIKTVQNDSFG